MSKRTGIYLTSMFASCVLGFALCNYIDASQAPSQEIIGRIEYIALEDYNMRFKSRIDTGAGVSSINAKIISITPAAKAGEPEKITYEITDSFNRSKTITNDIVEWARIKKKGSHGYIKRPVVKMNILLGGEPIEARVNLADRSTFLYPFLVGRNVIKAGGFLVDPEKSFLKHSRKNQKRYM